MEASTPTKSYLVASFKTMPYCEKRPDSCSMAYHKEAILPSFRLLIELYVLVLFSSRYLYLLCVTFNLFPIWSFRVTVLLQLLNSNPTSTLTTTAAYNSMIVSVSWWACCPRVPSSRWPVWSGGLAAAAGRKGARGCRGGPATSLGSSPRLSLDRNHR